MADWPAIKAEFQQGISQRSLALKYGISQAAISKRASREHWVITPVITPITHVITDNPDDPPNLMNIVDAALNDLSNYSNGTPDLAKLTLKDHKLFSDSFTQYMKAKLTIPLEQETSAYDMRVLLSHASLEQLAVLKPILANLTAKQKAASTRQTG